MNMCIEQFSSSHSHSRALSANMEEIQYTLVRAPVVSCKL